MGKKIHNHGEAEWIRRKIKMEYELDVYKNCGNHLIIIRNS
jgi:hypothetical protein